MWGILITFALALLSLSPSGGGGKGEILARGFLSASQSESCRKSWEPRKLSWSNVNQSEL